MTNVSYYWMSNGQGKAAHKSLLTRADDQSSLRARAQQGRSLGRLLFVAILSLAALPACLKAVESGSQADVEQTTKDTATTASPSPETASQDSTAAPTSTSPPLPTTRSELASYLSQLTDEQRQELAVYQQQFEQLSAQEKERLRALNAKLQADPRAQELQQVLEQYSVWLSSLPLKERSAIQDMKPTERIERIRDLRRREQDSRLTELGLTDRDTQTILEWIQSQVVEHEEELVALLSPEEKKWRDQARNAEERRWMTFLRPDRQSDLLKLVTAADYNRLADQLSSSAKDRLLATSGSENAKQRIELLSSWIHASFMTRVRPPEVSKEKLLEFFEKELDKSVRDELESLPRDRFYAELRNLYNMAHRNRWGGRGDGRRGGGRPDRGGEDRPGDRNGGRRRGGFGPGGREGRPPRPEDGGPPRELEGRGGDFPPPDFDGPPDGPPPEGPPPRDPPPEHQRPDDRDGETESNERA